MQYFVLISCGHEFLLFVLIKGPQIDMPRGKLVMKFVENFKKRELTYKKRLRSLVNKISQLSALCGVDIVFVGVKPGTAGAGGGRGVTTWPADHNAQKLITRFLEMPPQMIKENLNIGMSLQGELDKKERTLVKANECSLDDLLPMCDSHFNALSVDELFAVHQAMGERLERGHWQWMITELGCEDVVATSAAAITTPALQHAPAFPCNAFDMNLSDAGSSVGAQDHGYLSPDILRPPFPVQSPYVGFQLHMQPPYITFGAPPAAAAGFDDNFAMQGSEQGFAAGPAVEYHQEFQYPGSAVAYHQEFQSLDAAVEHHQDFQGYNFDAAGIGAGAYGFDAAETGAGYELEPGSAGISLLSNPLDTAAYQLQNDTLLWPDNSVGQHALGEQEEPSGPPPFDGRM
jgi:hypothetical protein